MRIPVTLFMLRAAESGTARPPVQARPSMRKTKLYVLRLAMKPVTVCGERFDHPGDRQRSTPRRFSSGAVFEPLARPGAHRLGDLPRAYLNVHVACGPDLRMPGAVAQAVQALTAIMMAARVNRLPQKTVCSKGKTPVHLHKAGGMPPRVRLPLPHARATGQPPTGQRRCSAAGRACRQALCR